MLTEDNNIVPTEVEKKTKQINQAMAIGGEKQLVMKEYARTIIGIVVSCMQLCEVACNNELKNVHFTMLPSFYDTRNAGPLIFIWDFYAMK